MTLKAEILIPKRQVGITGYGADVRATLARGGDCRIWGGMRMDCL